MSVVFAYPYLHLVTKISLSLQSSLLTVNCKIKLSQIKKIILYPLHKIKELSKDLFFTENFLDSYSSQI